MKKAKNAVVSLKGDGWYNEDILLMAMKEAMEKMIAKNVESAIRAAANEFAKALDEDIPKDSIFIAALKEAIVVIEEKSPGHFDIIEEKYKAAQSIIDTAKAMKGEVDWLERAFSELEIRGQANTVADFTAAQRKFISQIKEMALYLL